MPPYPYRAGEVSLPGAPSLHTHSSKYPIEREVIVRSGEKQCKIPILADYMRRAKSTVAPDVPQKQLAWTNQVKPADMAGSSHATGMSQEVNGHQIYKAVPVLESSCGSEPSPIRPVDSNHPTVVDSVPATSTPEENARGLPSRTYRSLKEIVTKGFSNNKNAVETSLSPQSQLRQAGVYLQPQPTPVQYRAPAQQQQPQHALSSNDAGYRIYSVGPYTETPRRDLSKAPSHDNLLQQDNRYRQDGNGGSQTIYMQQQEQRVIYGQAGPGPSRLQYLYSNQQTPDNRINYPEPSRPVQYAGQRHFNYTPEELASQRRQFAEQQRHNELQQQRLFGERLAGEGQQQSRPGDGGGGGGSGGIQFDHGRNQQELPSHQQHTPRLHHQNLELPSNLYSERQRHLDQPPSSHYFESRQISENNQRPANEQYQLNEIKNQDVKQPESTIQENGMNSDEGLKSQNKLDQPKPSSPEDDDEGGFVKRGAQSDSGRGSTVYSSVKAKPATTTGSGEKGEEWSERVETELRQILSGSGGSSDSISSVSPPLPPLSPPGSSGEDRPKFSLNGNSLGLGSGFKAQSGPLWVSRATEKSARSHHKPSKSASNLLSSRLEIDSMLDENNTSDEELDYADTRLIRKQLEGLESMYGQVLKLLKAKRQHGYEGLDLGNLRHSRRRTCGSVSSVPSSVSSRPIRVSRSQPRGKIRDFKGINKRFQRLESHVVTLARSVAHLSSEMRTQHLMMQEMEVMRGELAALRIQSNAHHQQQHTQPMVMNPGRVGQGNSATPDKVKRLTKFFGDEPPLLRLFLRGLGYEKYASLFEKERIGLLELPYLTEERLHKLGIPLGPRLRILQQAHLANPNTLAVL